MIVANGSDFGTGLTNSPGFTFFHWACRTINVREYKNALLSV